MSLRLLLVAVAHARLAPIRQRAASLRGGADAAWDALRAHVAADIESTHLRDLLRDDARNAALTFACGDITLDCSRQRATVETLRLLAALGEARGVAAKRDAMLRGDLVNESEGRAALHTALRAPRGAAPVLVDGADVHAAIHDTLDRAYAFAGKVRAGGVGSTGKMLTNVVAIGIGGSCLGPECVYEALRSEPAAQAAAAGRSLRFISNVNPAMAVAGHFCAVSSDVEKAANFGVEPDNVFGFGDYVGGRFSVHSPVGALPLALHFGPSIFRKFLEGARACDDHFASAPLEENLPVLLGLFGAYNSAVLGFPCRAVLPYAQALSRFPAHVQQLDMESNGKSVASDGSALAGDAGEIIFGEPGTNGQHSFYQLMHQGRAVPAEFIGFCESQRPAHAKGRPLSCHDELMANFFAQPDALAMGDVDEAHPERACPGNRPSLSLLLPRLDAYHVGFLVALYEHRVAVQSFLFGNNAFDQWGVQLGKVLAGRVADALGDAAEAAALNSSTRGLVAAYRRHARASIEAVASGS
ncbi:hypothetical protein AURANDRAFT_69855 [Aureococcus anophagefferens]|uniref:Glucose-6-phosphate isomerase n=1 Tax=Aureococcus anophagefferens TaxID=44056 RepID=F0YD40_AURAN|nr:hypothetical protein AURANDRAFT_69855 [Aureococcus anophagefferens]EGB06990.1 hypothetical protein AURANDRAFT_69855 [Aureococcus anophagefferens]|eukprot:XP_009038231.1 hypothetical protein AURANDRAFT_69855 [Aureococcus anophagefferens]